MIGNNEMPNVDGIKRSEIKSYFHIRLNLISKQQFLFIVAMKNGLKTGIS
jgi:hypothetical protein